MSKNYTGKIKENHSSYEKAYYYQVTSNRLYNKADYIYFFLLLNYPAYLVIQLIIWIFINANKQFDIKKNHHEVDDIPVPFKENFDF